MIQNRINVAVVDNDESFACALERLFRASGFAVRTYLSAEAFLAARTPLKLDCLVLDIHLGGMSGLDLQRRLGDLGTLEPIIFVTAHDAPGVRQEAERAGCAGYFLKPVAGKSLIAAITKAANPSSRGSENDAASKPQ